MTYWCHAGWCIMWRRTTFKMHTNAVTTARKVKIELLVKERKKQCKFISTWLFYDRIYVIVIYSSKCCLSLWRPLNLNWTYKFSLYIYHHCKYMSKIFNVSCKMQSSTCFVTIYSNIIIYKIGNKLHLIQATVLKLIKQPAMMKSLLGVVLLEMEEFPIVLAMLMISVERYTLNKKRYLNNHYP